MNKLSSGNMNADYISQHDIVQRYLKGKLTPEETVEFEEYIVDKPELLEELEVDSVMVEHLPKLKTAAQRLRPSSLWMRLFGTPLKASLGTGFAVLLVVALFAPHFNQQGRPLDGNIALYYLSEVRGQAGIEQTVDVAKTTDTIIFVLDVEIEQSTPYKVSLLNIDSDTRIALSQRYLASEVGEIYVSIPAKNLPKGRYLIEYHPVNQKSDKRILRLLIE